MHVFVNLHPLVRTVKLKWILVHQTAAKTQQNARRAQIIKTFTVHAQLGTLEDFVTKISTNVSNQHHHVEMERLAKI